MLRQQPETRLSSARTEFQRFKINDSKDLVRFMGYVLLWYPLYIKERTGSASPPEKSHIHL
jgi:hypothetical protein